MNKIFSLFSSIFAALSAKILASHVVITLLGAVIISVFAAASGCTGSKAEPAAPPPAVTASGSSSTIPPPPSQATGTAAPQPTVPTAPPAPTMAQSPCGPGPCGVPSNLPLPAPTALPVEYFTGKDAMESPHCRMAARAHRWHLVGNAYGRDETVVAAMCGRAEFMAYPKKQSYTFAEGALVVSDGKIVSGITDISVNGKPGTTTHARHPLLNEEVNGKRLVNVWITDNTGAPYLVTLNNPMVVELSSTDGALEPKDICSKYKGIDNPSKEHPWIQLIWSRCQLAPTTHNVSVIKTMDKVWTEQKDHSALAARVEKLEQLERKVVAEVKASGDKPVPVQQIVGFNASAPN